MVKRKHVHLRMASGLNMTFGLFVVIVVPRFCIFLIFISLKLRNNAYGIPIFPQIRTVNTFNTLILAFYSHVFVSWILKFEVLIYFLHHDSRMKVYK